MIRIKMSKPAPVVSEVVMRRLAKFFPDYAYVGGLPYAADPAHPEVYTLDSGNNWWATIDPDDPWVVRVWSRWGDVREKAYAAWVCACTAGWEIIP